MKAITVMLLCIIMYAGQAFAQQQVIQGQRIPRMSTEQRDQIPVRNNPQAEGLFVFNTDINCLQYWTGQDWANLCGEVPLPAGEARLACEGATLDPIIAIRNGQSIPVGTFLKIPYSASNGGTHHGITLYSEGNPNLTATLNPGELTPGTGVLTFALSGTPERNQEAPIGVTFDLTPFLEQNPGFSGCDRVTVGHLRQAVIHTTAVMGYLESMVDSDGHTVWALESDSPDGLFSVRVFFPGNLNMVQHGHQNLNVQLRNNRPTSTAILWNYSTFWGGGTMNGSGLVPNVPSRRWGGIRGSGAGTTFTVAESPNGNGHWGDRGIYDASGHGPEYRRYTWIEIGDTKTAYEVTVMAAINSLSPTVGVSPTQVKAYIKFQQVTGL